MLRIHSVSYIKLEVITTNESLFEDEPGKPGRPEPKDWDKDFVELAWRPPVSDGGAPIEKYIIQMHDKAGRGWVDAATVPGDKTSGRVDNVDEGHEYEFRIVAVNKAGPSEPSDPSKPVIAKPRFRKLFNTKVKPCLQ